LIKSVALWAYSRPGTDEELEMKKRTTSATMAKTMYRRYLAAIVAMVLKSGQDSWGCDGKKGVVVKCHDSRGLEEHHVKLFVEKGTGTKSQSS
jgi:predicted Mrr-cat superfamily restriction endonuclease